MTHGWPGSVIELLDTVGPLTDPTAHGGTPEDAFHLVLPSLPGYGFSGEPTELGWESGRIATRVGGADGAPRLHALRRPGGRRGRRRHGRDGAPGARGAASASTSACSRGRSASPINCRRNPSRNARRTTRSRRSGRVASATSWSSPPGRRRSATPCWIHPSGSRPGCSTMTRTATTRSPARSSTASPWAISPGTSIVDNITLYWLTGTGASAARWYWEFGQFLAAAGAAGRAPPPVSVPVGFTTFPGEIWAAPRSWVETVYPGLAYFNEVDRGGHFAAWEEPELFSAEVRAAFRSLRPHVERKDTYHVAADELQRGFAGRDEGARRRVRICSPVGASLAADRSRVPARVPDQRMRLLHRLSFARPPQGRTACRAPRPRRRMARSRQHLRRAGKGGARVGGSRDAPRRPGVPDSAFEAASAAFGEKSSPT